MHATVLSVASLTSVARRRTMDTAVPGLIASLGFLAVTGLAGVAIARRWFPFLVTLEAIAYGIPLGVVLASVAILLLAFAFGLTPLLVALVGLSSVAATIVLWPRPWAFTPPTRVTLARIARPVSAASLLPALVLGALAVRWLAFWLGALRYEPDGLWAGHINIWGDWPVHLGILTSFAYGANFPPEHPRFAEHPLGYHYLADLTPAALVQLGADPVSALALHSFLFSVLVALGVYAFARRLGLPGSAAALVVALFFVGGGLGWLVTLSDMLASRDPLGTLAREPWNAAHVGELNVRWQNMYFGFFAPQRAFLYGLPLALLVLTSLLAAVGTTRGFLAAGIVAGLLPLAHLPTMLALGIVTPVLFALFPSPRWVLFFGAWGLLAAPQLLLQQGAGPGPLAAFRLQTGWVAAPDPWPLFWLKNLGAFVPLAAAALAERALLPRQAVRLLWAFMPIFVVLNLVVFQPWDWDNHKALVYWFLGVCILTGAFLARTWELSSAPMRIAVAGLAATMLFSGALENVDQLLGRDRHLLLTAEEVALAAEVRARTDPRAMFVIGLQSNHPVGMLSGRRVLMGYPGWLWTEGLPTAERERDVRAIYGFTSDAPGLLAKYRVDYVVIGPVEREQLRANVEAYRSRFPELLRTTSYEIFDVRRPALGDDRAGPQAGHARDGASLR